MGRVPIADADTMCSLARTHVMMAKTSVLMTVPNTAKTQISEKYLKNRFFLSENPAANTVVVMVISNGARKKNTLVICVHTNWW